MVIYLFVVCFIKFKKGFFMYDVYRLAYVRYNDKISYQGIVFHVPRVRIVYVLIYIAYRYCDCVQRFICICLLKAD